ncbi:MAG: hypothetical protein Q7V43_02600 [Myxococcales bacterium]|nr:hypothetical protein [Myxococcales bacterium]
MGLACDEAGVFCVVPMARTACVGPERTCPSGQQCVHVGAASQCVASAGLGGPCNATQPCGAGLFCDDYGTCRETLAVGAPCEPMYGQPCGPELVCREHGISDWRCVRRGGANSPCRLLRPVCDGDLQCRNDFCVAVLAAGAPCRPGDCGLDASCEGPSVDEWRCREFGVEGGRCRRTPGSIPCDAPLRCGATGLCEP